MGLFTNWKLDISISSQATQSYLHLWNLQWFSCNLILVRSQSAVSTLLHGLPAAKQDTVNPTYHQQLQADVQMVSMHMFYSDQQLYGDKKRTSVTCQLASHSQPAMSDFNYIYTPCPHKKVPLIFCNNFYKYARIFNHFLYSTLQMNTNHTGKFTTLHGMHIPYLVK